MQSLGFIFMQIFIYNYQCLFTSLYICVQITAYVAISLKNCYLNVILTHESNFAWAGSVTGFCCHPVFTLHDCAHDYL